MADNWAFSISWSQTETHDAHCLTLFPSTMANSLESTCLGSAVAWYFWREPNWSKKTQDPGKAVWDCRNDNLGRLLGGGIVLRPRVPFLRMYSPRYFVGEKFVDGRRSSPRALSRYCFQQRLSLSPRLAVKLISRALTPVPLSWFSKFLYVLRGFIKVVVERTVFLFANVIMCWWHHIGSEVHRMTDLIRNEASHLSLPTLLSV